jgi:hypothetical protein
MSGSAAESVGGFQGARGGWKQILLRRRISEVWQCERQVNQEPAAVSPTVIARVPYAGVDRLAKPTGAAQREEVVGHRPFRGFRGSGLIATERLYLAAQWDDVRLPRIERHPQVICSFSDEYENPIALPSVFRRIPELDRTSDWNAIEMGQ